MSLWILPFIFGALAVLQGGVNRIIGQHWGLSSAILLNSLLLAIVAILFFFICYYFPSIVPPHLKPQLDISLWRWWWVIPSLCGFILILCIPALIPRLGASGIFLGIMVGQISSSLMWDLFYEKTPIDNQRLIGVALALAGLLISSWKLL